MHIPRPDGRLELVQPAQCPNGHRFGPHQVLVSFLPCWCAANDARGHHLWACRECGATIFDPPHDPERQHGGDAYAQKCAYVQIHAQVYN